MRITKLFLQTLKEAPNDAQITSSALMIRGGFIRKISSGLYAYFPLGVRVLNKISNIVRSEMNSRGALECLMPLLLSRDLLTPSGRWEIFRKELFRLEDRHGVPHAIGPTHEEAFTETVKNALQSYRDLPINLYQINTKFRDEIRPRFGVIRSREFIMHDAYSFHITSECLDRTYNDMSEAYGKSFNRMGLQTVSVKADPGAMGGDGSEEFMVLSNVGEECIIFCDACGYKSNVEKATVLAEKKAEKYTDNAFYEVNTPNIITIDDLVKHYDFEKQSLIKTLLYTTDDGDTVMVLIRGDIEVNETKLSNFLNGALITLSDTNTVESITGARVGFAGPINLNKEVRIIADYSINTIYSAGVGGNKDDTHITSVNIERDFVINDWVDLRVAKEGDACPNCGEHVYSKRGLELAHIFKLGSKYTEAFNVSVLDENNKPLTPIMGCYGLGINRAFAAVIEQNHDEKGIIFPISIAPYEVIIVIGDKEGSKSYDVAFDIYNKLNELNVEVLIDDRDERFGVKLNDADLIGIPIRIVVGKRSVEKSMVECKLRSSNDVVEVEIENILSYILEVKKELFQKLI